MIVTIRRTGGPAGTDETLGRVDDLHLDAGTRTLLALQLEALADLTSSHEPSAADGLRYEVEVQGPGRTTTFLAVEETGDPELPALQALFTFMRTLGLDPSIPSAVS
jgi:hypothetical protein